MKFDYKIGEVYIDTDKCLWEVLEVNEQERKARLQPSIPSLWDLDWWFDEKGSEIVNNFQLVRRLFSGRCECGSKACRGLTHSDWCPMHESGGKEPYKLPNQLLF